MQSGNGRHEKEPAIYGVTRRSKSGQGLAVACAVPTDVGQPGDVQRLAQAALARPLDA
jgi:hypothetical protein